MLSIAEADLYSTHLKQRYLYLSITYVDEHLRVALMGGVGVRNIRARLFNHIRFPT
jgi:hypothetical protein